VNVKCGGLLSRNGVLLNGASSLTGLHASVITLFVSSDCSNTLSGRDSSSSFSSSSEPLYVAIKKNYLIN